MFNSNFQFLIVMDIPTILLLASSEKERTEAQWLTTIIALA